MNYSDVLLNKFRNENTKSKRKASFDRPLLEKSEGTLIVCGESQFQDFKISKRSNPKRKVFPVPSVRGKTPLAELMDAQCWRQLPLQHVWNLGYQAFPVMRIICALPIRLKLALKQISDVLHTVTVDSTLRLGNVRKITKFRPCGDIESSHLHSPDISEIWDQDQHFGLIKVLFDPETQVRQGVDANRRAGEFWGLNKEGFLFRYLQNNIPLLSCELDWLRAFVVYIARYFDDSVTQYVRLNTGFGASFSHCLARITTVKTFDSCGRIAQVPSIS